MASISVLQALKLIRHTPQDVLREHRHEVVLTFNSIQSLLDCWARPVESSEQLCFDSPQTTNPVNASTSNNPLPSPPLTFRENSWTPITQRAEETEITGRNTPEARQSTEHAKSSKLGSDVTKLLQSLDKESTAIETYLSKTPVNAVGEPEWKDEDVRVLDLKFSESGSESMQVRFRKTLSRRSLAVQFDDWERKENGSSTIHESAKNTSNTDWKSKSHVPKYLQQAIGIKDLKTATTGIRFGVKFLIIEQKLSHLQSTTQKYAGIRPQVISAILGFAAWRLRNMKVQLFDTLVQKIVETSWIMKLVTDKEEWFEKCQKFYDGC